MRKILLVALVAAVVATGLVGCAVHQPTIQDWQVRCTGYGYPAGTMAYAQCVERESIRAYEQSYRGRVHRAMQQQESSRTIRCESDLVGGFVCN
jgi:hypothetical protein